MMRKLQSLVLALVLVFPGCQLFDNSDPELVIHVDDDIVLTMREDLGDSGNGFFLNMTSSDPTDCGGLQYNYQYTIDKNQLFFNITGLKNPEDCMGDAYHVISEAHLSPVNGSYAVRFMIGEDIENAGTMVVNDERINLSFPGGHGLSMPHETLYRIPDGTIWGYLSGSSDLSGAYAWLEENIMSFGRESDLKQGFYGYFEIAGEEQSVRIHPDPADPEHFPFVFQIDESESRLETLSASFAEMFNSDIQLVLTAWTGKHF